MRLAFDGFVSSLGIRLPQSPLSQCQGKAEGAVERVELGGGQSGDALFQPNFWNRREVVAIDHTGAGHPVLRAERHFDRNASDGGGDRGHGD